MSSRSKFERVLYLDARPLTDETRLSLASRLAPTGTRTARSAIIWARAPCAFRVEDVARAFVSRVPAVVRLVVRAPLPVVRALALAGLRRVVVLRLGVVGFGVPGLLVDIVLV